MALWTRVMVGGGERATDDQDVVTRDKCPPKDRLYLPPFLNAGSPIHPSIHPVRTGCGEEQAPRSLLHIHPAAAAAVICFTAVHIQLLLMSRLFFYFPDAPEFVRLGLIIWPAFHFYFFFCPPKGSDNWFMKSPFSPLASSSSGDWLQLIHNNSVCLHPFGRGRPRFSLELQKSTASSSIRRRWERKKEKVIFALSFVCVRCLLACPIVADL